ncbi:metallophosphoesterase family protein [Planococcus salinus]|uniref:DNA repair exonuclease n=1 Tax=Planococcus salinus TaxID=1848460 RepID=A0A3M8P6W8_9BACL|nr:DNA repair exonuclease [Planococcus salinus]RNF39418.1 DNA repair exonuclease [Planococcus salinus]
MGHIRFIHAADLHLGSPFIGMKGLQKEHWQALKDSTFVAFDRLIEYTVNERPDFLLIVGDIYDGENRSLRAQHRFQLGMQRLHEQGIPVIISYGNHDHLSGKWTRFELPDNVFAFDAAVGQIRLDTAGGPVSITGFSYGERHIKESVVNRYPQAEERDVLHIGMLHGSMEGDTNHAVYAPFTKEQLLSRNYDYWALGHIHKRQVLHQDPPIVYPGNLQGRHRNEAGAKGFYDVTLSKQQVNQHFVEASAIQFVTIPINCSGIAHMNELLELCAETLETWGDQGPMIADLRFTSIDEETAGLFDAVTETELMETVRETAEVLDRFVWIDQLVFESPQLDSETSPLSENLIDVLTGWELNDWKEVLKELYRHPKGSRYLETLNDSATQEIGRLAVEKIRHDMQLKE